jgi:2-dehydropantoate 2-reductase
MGYVVFGAGAIGAVVGGRLCQAGYDVTLIARGAHLEAIRARGLRLESPDGSETTGVPATSCSWR